MSNGAGSGGVGAGMKQSKQSSAAESDSSLSDSGITGVGARVKLVPTVGVLQQREGVRENSCTEPAQLNPPAVTHEADVGDGVSAATTSGPGIPISGSLRFTTEQVN